jgi:RHS repeat-associated protein
MVDHLGSTDAVVSGAATPSASDTANPSAGSTQAFTMWGQRRDIGTWKPMADSVIYGFDNQLTRKGFTGHEEVDLSGLVHMGGRVYDPRLGRFIQADPFVEDPYLPQTLNRYTYVRNNPLSYTDPSGYFTTQQAVFMIAAIAVTVATGGAAVSAFAAGNFAAGAAVAAVGGFSASIIQGGSLKQSLFSAFTAVVTAGVGGYAQAAELGRVGTAVAQGAAGGVVEQLHGGNFAHGFLVAGASTFAHSLVPTGQPGVMNAGHMLAHSLIGGSISHLSGGKFGNGAATSAMSYLVQVSQQKQLRTPRKFEDISEHEARQFIKQSPQFAGADAVEHQSLRLTQQWANGALDEKEYADRMCGGCSDPTMQKIGIYGTIGVATFGVGLELMGAGAASETIMVSRWGRPGLQAGDWVMKGGRTWWNYLRSGKWDPGPWNQFAAFGAGESFMVEEAAVVIPEAEGILGTIKGYLLGQFQYLP